MTIKKAKMIFAILAIITTIFVPENLLIAKNKPTKKISTKKIVHKKQIKKNKTTRPNLVVESINKLKKYYPEYYNFLNNDTTFTYIYDSKVDVSTNSHFNSISLRYDLIYSINSWLGVPYHSPGRSKRGVDCSNFVSCITSESMGINFPAGSATQARMFRPIYKLDSLQFGDLIFFTGRDKNSNRVGHVGFYIGNGLFAHSSTDRGVIYTHITEGYYAERYKFGGRFNTSDWVVNPSKKSKGTYYSQMPE